MVRSLKNGSMVVAALCAFAFTATADAAAATSTQRRQSMELANIKRSDPNDSFTPAGAAHKAAKKEDCKWANASSRNDVAVIAKAGAGGQSTGGHVHGANAVR